METNFIIFFVAALVPLIVGAIWYNPNVFGRFAYNVNEGSKGHKPMVYILTYIFSLFMAFVMYSWFTHQLAITGLFFGEVGFQEAGSEIDNLFNSLMESYGDNHRNFGHGAFHGLFAGILFAMPVIAIRSMFEGKRFKSIAVHAGYWILCATLMGGLVNAYA